MIYNNSEELQYGLSIVIPTYNKSELLSKTVKSLLNQSTSPDLYEIIVVNDGSSDDTHSILNDLKEAHNNIRYFMTPDDGFRVSRARNIGINAAKYTYVLLFDSGMIAAPNLVEQHLRGHHSATDKVILGLSYGVEETTLSACNTIIRQLEQSPLNEAFANMAEIRDVQDCRYSYFQKLNFDMSALAAPWVVCWTGHVSFSKNMAIVVGGFDEWFNSWGGEDIEFGYRLFRAGGQFLMLKETLSIHYPHSKDPKQKESSGKENLKYIIAKHSDIYMEKLLTEPWQTICDHMITTQSIAAKKAPCKGKHMQPNQFSTPSVTKPLCVVHVNANFHRRGEGVYFGIGDVHQSRSPIISLSPFEQALFDIIDGRRHLIEYAWQYNSAEISVEKTFQSWYEAGVIELINPPIRKNKKVVVVEPHMDDAALSVGGSMLKYSSSKQFYLVTMVGRSNYTSYSHKKTFPVDQVSAIRRNESQLYSQRVDAQYLCLDELDQPIRWQNRDETDLPCNHSIASTADKLMQVMRAIQPDEVWLPLGLEFHADHHRARDSALKMLNHNSAFFKDVVVKMYEDVPYVLNFPESFKHKVLNHIGLCRPAELVRENITAQFSEKLRSISIFRSQFKGEVMAPHVKLAAKKVESEDEYYEDFWQLSGQPQEIPYSFWEQLGSINSAFNLLKNTRTINLVKCDFFVPYDFELFLELFPHLTVNLYIPEKEQVRVGDFTSHRVKITTIPDDFYEQVNHCKSLLEHSLSPILLFLWEMKWPAYRNYLKNHCQNEPDYVSIWFSSFVMSVKKLYESNG